MQILFDYQIFCKQKHGGISRYFTELANKISSTSNHNFKILAPFYFNEYLTPLSPKKIIGIKTPRLPIVLGPFVLTKINNFISCRLQRSFSDFDIFHETYYSISDCKPKAAKRVITVYDMTHEIFADSYFKDDQFSKIKAHAIQRADHVICISKNTQRDLLDKFGVPEEKTSVIYLGHSLTDSSNTHIALPLSKPFILFIGKRPLYKNFIKLLSAFAGSTRIRDNFSMVCFGGGPFSSDEKCLIKNLGLSSLNIVQLSGNDQLLSTLYMNAKAFVYPSLYEGFGIPLIEAMSLGCPVACSNSSCFPEIVGTAAELFNPYDEAEIISSIERIVFNSDISESLITKGYERVKKFSWAKCAQQTLNVYENLVQE